MRVYISGPITGHDDYKERFAAAEKRLTAAGYIAVNPAKMAEVFPAGDYNTYMSLDHQLLRLCDAICMLPGWQHSEGARKELVYALETDKQILEMSKEE